jgi:hypothetical protein
MKIRYIAAALAAPALALGALLASAGGASAATLPQVLHVQVLNDPDSGVYQGMTWANDNISRWYQVTYLGSNNYDVRTTDYGIWNAVPGAIAPLDTTGTTHMGSEHGLFTGRAHFVVNSPNGAPSEALLRSALGGTTTVDAATSSASYGQLILDAFPSGATLTDQFDPWSWTYFGPHGERMVQQAASLGTPYSDSPTAGIFTNGG